MTNELAGKVAIVTGASRGIGADIARVLAKQGMTVIASARTVDEGDFHIPGSLRETVDSIVADGGKAIARRCDLAKEADVQALWDFATSEFPEVHAVINNAGIAIPGTIAGMSWKHFQLNLTINVTAPILLSRLAAPHMAEHGWGAIVNISSGASKGPGQGPYAKVSTGGTPYGLTKSALERFTQGMAAETWQDNVSVNCIMPAKQIFVGGTIYVAKTDPAFAVSDLSGKRKDGTIMGDACVALMTADHKVATGIVATDEGALTMLTGATDFRHYAEF